MEEHSTDIDISVIVPVYNASAFLDKSLGSLVVQPKKNIEFICINDGSTDNSLKILQEYAEKDSRFIILDKANGGVSTARNLGLEHAKGKYIMFLDADDWYSDNTCDRAYQMIEESQVDLVLFCMTMEYSDHSEYRRILRGKTVKFDENGCKNLHRQTVGLIDDECKEIQKLDYLSLLYLKIYRRAIIEENRIRFVDIKKIGSLEDGLFLMDYMAHIQSAMYTEESLYHYNRYNVDSITTKYRQELPTQWEYLFYLIDEKTGNLGYDYKHALNNRMAYSMFSLGLNVMSGPQDYAYKCRMVQQLFKKSSIYRSFTYKEISCMPIAFRPFFLVSKWRFSFIAAIMLYVMQWVRDRNKGI